LRTMKTDIKFIYTSFEKQGEFIPLKKFNQKDDKEQKLTTKVTEILSSLYFRKETLRIKNKLNLIETAKEKKDPLDILQTLIEALNLDVKKDSKPYLDETLIKQVIQAFSQWRLLRPMHDNAITSLFINDRTIVTASSDGKIKKWNFIDDSEQISYHHNEDSTEIAKCYFLGSPDSIVIAYLDGDLFFRSRKTKESNIKEVVVEELALPGHAEKIACLCHLGDNTFISSDKNTLKIWNPNKKNLLRFVSFDHSWKSFNEKSVTAIEHIASQGFIFFGNTEGYLKFIDTKNNYKIDTIRQEHDSPISVIKKWDEETLLIGYDEIGLVQTYDIKSKKFKDMGYIEYDMSIRVIESFEDKEHFVTSTADGKIKIWDYKTRSCLQRFEAEAEVVTLKVDTSESCLWVGCKDGALRRFYYSFKENESKDQDLIRKKFLIKNEKLIYKKNDKGERIFLGSGTFGDVYKGDYKGELVAIKEIKVDELALRYGLGQDDIEQSFNNEVDMMLKISDFASFMGLKAFISENDEYKMVMEFMKGSLKGYLKTKVQEATWEEKWQLMMHLTLSLLVLHSLNIRHRDIKPDNIFIKYSSEGSIQTYLGDWGTARQDINTSTDKTGTPPYGCPWYWSDKEGHKRCTEKYDIYALGAVFYEILSGKSESFPPIYKSDFNAIISILKNLKPPHETPPSLRGLLNSFWKEDLNKRPDAGMILSALLSAKHEFIEKDQQKQIEKELKECIDKKQEDDIEKIVVTLLEASNKSKEWFQWVEWLLGHYHPSLKRLNLTQAKIDNNTLALLNELKGLEEINLENCLWLDNEGVKKIQELKSLKKLNIRAPNNQVTDEAVDELAKSLKLESFRYINKKVWKVYSEYVCGIPHWEKIFGKGIIREEDRGSDFESLPKDILQIMSEKNRKNQIFTWIPKKIVVEGEVVELTDTLFGKLIKKSFSETEGGYGLYKSKFIENDFSLSQSCWVLLTKPLPESGNKNYENQEKLVKELKEKEKDPDLQVPGVLETTVSLVMHYLKTKEIFYKNTDTRCQEKVQNCQLVVGGLTEKGIKINNCSPNRENVRMGVMKKFYV
jgi:serine/threonine protein kinase